MSFRRVPFQFSSSNLGERQRELEKRFGLPSQRNMYVDFANPLITGASQLTGSPRLQHRVPIFTEGHEKPVSSSVDSKGFVPEKKPNVRVIPIEIEGAENRGTRHRTLSGPAGIAKDQDQGLICERSDTSPLNQSMEDLSNPLKIKPSAGPRVYNIPIQVEGRSPPKKSESKVSSNFKNDSKKVNGCSVSKSVKVKTPEKEKKGASESNQKQSADKQETVVEKTLKKIEDILEEFKTYQAGVNDFQGTSKDKQYRYLDEMLTQCMLRLDNIDTMGNESVRLARKGAVKKIQASIDLLESKSNASSNTDSEIKLPEMDGASEENNFAKTEPQDHTVDIVKESEVDMQENDHESQNETNVISERSEVEINEMVEDKTENGNEVVKENVNTVVENEVEMKDVDDQNSELNSKESSHDIVDVPKSSEKSEIGENFEIDTEHADDVQKGTERNEFLEDKTTLGSDIVSEVPVLSGPVASGHSEKVMQNAEESVTGALKCEVSEDVQMTEIDATSAGDSAVENKVDVEMDSYVEDNNDTSSQTVPSDTPQDVEMESSQCVSELLTNVGVREGPEQVNLPDACESLVNNEIETNISSETVKSNVTTEL